MSTTLIAVTIVSIVVVVVSIGVKWFIDTKHYIKVFCDYPDESYDFFSKDSVRWIVFEVGTPELVSDQLPDAKGLPQGKLLGPFQFRVPKRHNRVVTVYGKSEDCLKALDQFVFNLDERRSNQI